MTTNSNPTIKQLNIKHANPDKSKGAKYIAFYEGAAQGESPILFSRDVTTDESLDKIFGDRKSIVHWGRIVKMSVSGKSGEFVLCEKPVEQSTNGHKPVALAPAAKPIVVIADPAELEATKTVLEALKGLDTSTPASPFGKDILGFENVIADAAKAAKIVDYAEVRIQNIVDDSRKAIESVIDTLTASAAAKAATLQKAESLGFVAQGILDALKGERKEILGEIESIKGATLEALQNKIAEAINALGNLYEKAHEDIFAAGGEDGVLAVGGKYWKFWLQSRNLLPEAAPKAEAPKVEVKSEALAKAAPKTREECAEAIRVAQKAQYDNVLGAAAEVKRLQRLAKTLPYQSQLDKEKAEANGGVQTTEEVATVAPVVEEAPKGKGRKASQKARKSTTKGRKANQPVEGE